LEARDRGVDLSPKTVTVTEILASYIERCQTKAFSTKNIERYDALARCHILPVIGGVPLPRLKRAHVLDVYARAKTSARAKTVRHAASSTKTRSAGCC
jgi:hypothetical protein